MVSDTLARGKVDRGLTHPYFADVGKALLQAWDADRAVSRKGLKGYVEQTVENTRTLSKIWMESAAKFGATGVPVDPPQISDRISGDNNALAMNAVRRALRNQFRATRRATFKVVQDRKGVLQEVTLLSPSNDPEVDREAMADVRAAAEKLPPPPPEAIGPRDTLVSVWQFELIVSISPPIPTISFEFDEALKFIDARMPLDRRIYKRVRLISAQ